MTAWLQQYVSLSVLLGLVLALFIFGLYRASYEIESEKRALEGKIETDEKRAAVAAELQQLYNQGIALRAEVMNSTDETPVSKCNDKLTEWRQSVHGYLAENATTGKAQYVDGVTSVPGWYIAGMKSSTTRNEKETIVLRLDEHLKRLAELMREY